MRKLFLFFLMIVFLTPISLSLVGCGATAVNQAQGVSFVSDLQNEAGQAVFELDLGSPLVLPYKINPSSAHGYAPRFTAVSGISGDNLETYSLDIVTGEFCINNTKFKDVEVEITVGSYKDVCKITLKKYPITVGIYDETQPNKINTDPEISLACGSSYQINLAGLFVVSESQVYNSETGKYELVQETETRLLRDDEYNILVEADESSKTLINVPNHNSLNFTTYNNYGSGSVKVAICDYYKNVKTNSEGVATLAFKINIHVYMPCKNIGIKISGADRIVSSSDNNKIINLNMDKFEYNYENHCYILDFSADFYDKYDRLIIDERLKIRGSVDKTTYLTIDNDAQKIYIYVPLSGGIYDFAIKFWSNASQELGGYCMTELILRVTF